MVTADAEVTTETPTLTETTQADTPVESTPLTGDAGQQEAVDAAPANDGASLEAEYEAYLQTQVGKESGEQAPEPPQDREEPQQPLVDPQQYAAAKRNYDSTYVRFDQNLSTLESALVEQLGESQAKLLLQPLKDRKNELHANGMGFWGLESATQAQTCANTAWATELRRGIEATLPKNQLPEFDTWLAEQAQTSGGAVPHKDWLAKLVELRVKADGYVPKARYEADKKSAWTDGRRARENAGEVSGSQSGAAISGSPSAPRLTYSQILKMTPAQIAAIPDDVYQKAVEEGK